MLRPPCIHHIPAKVSAPRVPDVLSLTLRSTESWSHFRAMMGRSVNDQSSGQIDDRACHPTRAIRCEKDCGVGNLGERG